MNMLKYEELELVVVTTSNEDIITASNDTPVDDWNGNSNS